MANALKHPLFTEVVKESRLRRGNSLKWRVSTIAHSRFVGAPRILVEAMIFCEVL